jgi:protein NrfD
MNPFVADPEWGWWITLYFFLGGIAAGAYFVATLIDLVGQEADRPLARLGYRLAFPLVALCGIFLTVDLERPERFWHMLFQSEVVREAVDAGWPWGGWGTMLRAAQLKWWSPMSIGAWVLALFGLWSSISFLMTFRGGEILARWLGQNWRGHLFRITGSCLGFFIASYTGALLTATNQPLWSLSDWIGPLFLTSASSTAIAVMLLFGRGVSDETRHRLERADLWALGLELILFLIFLASLGGLLPLVLTTWQGWFLVAGTLLAGLLIPLTLHFGLLPLGASRVTLAALFALAGGFLLRYGVVSLAPALLQPLDMHLQSVNEPLAGSTPGIALIAVTVLLALAIPMGLHRQWRLSWGWTSLAWGVSALAVGGVLFYSTRPTSPRAMVPIIALVKISPEDGRERGGGVGASIYNRPELLRLRTKIVESNK